MKVKKTKLPENLYHYTSLIKYRMISATGKLVLTPSNLKYDGATFHQEPLYFNGHEIGIKAVDRTNTGRNGNRATGQRDTNDCGQSGKNRYTDERTSREAHCYVLEMRFKPSI